MSKISGLFAGVIFCLVFTVAPLCAQGTKSVAASLTAAEAEKWREDLRVLATQMPLRHRNLFHTVKREEFEAAVKSLNERIPTLTRNQVIVEFMRLVGMAEDGHTGLAGLLWDPKIGFRSCPLTLYFFKDGLFVITADREHAAAVGARVLKIGNKSADEVYDAVKGLVSHDANNEFGLKAADPANAYQNVEAVMNAFGYRLMGMKRLDQAIEMFKLNTEVYPKSSNVWDSLGEAYMNKDEKELAIKNYEKSLELDPSNANAVQMLKRLRGM